MVNFGPVTSQFKKGNDVQSVLSFFKINLSDKLSQDQPDPPNFHHRYLIVQGYGTVTIITSNRAPWRFLYSVTLTFDLWPFDLWLRACRATAIEYQVCTKFGVDNSSRFPVSADKVQTKFRLDWTALPTPAAMLQGVGSYLTPSF